MLNKNVYAVFPVFFFAKFELNIFINCDLSWWLKLHTKAKKIWSHRGRKSFILLSKVDRMESLNHEWSHITHSHRFIDTQADRHFYLQKFFDEFSNNKFTFYKSRYSGLCEICTWINTQCKPTITTKNERLQIYKFNVIEFKVWISTNWVNKKYISYLICDIWFSGHEVQTV